MPTTILIPEESIQKSVNHYYLSIFTVLTRID